MFTARGLDRLMRWVVTLSGLLVVSIVVAVIVFLGRESKFAFDQKFGAGFRFAVTGPEVAADYDVDFDPNSAVMAHHPEGGEGLDEKEEMAPAPTVDMLVGSPGGILATQSPLNAPIDETNFTRDDWRPLMTAGESRQIVFMAFGSPDASGEKMVLRWKPDVGFQPAYAAHRLTLKVERVPEGITYTGPKEIDLKASPNGTLELPMWRAKTDAERAQGYVLSFNTTSEKSAVAATITNLFRTSWAPTNAYAQFGILPLILGTLLITIIAAAIATPIAIWLAVYMSEFAPSSLSRKIKPVIELLGNVPTVVLGYFGVILVAPQLQTVFQTDSGRMVLTAGIITAVLIIPLIATFADDALQRVPDSLRDGASALGLLPGEVVRKIILPAARPGLIGAALLGFARAFGETMIIWMLAGGTPGMPGWNVFGAAIKPSKGVADAIAVDMQNVVPEDPHYGHLFILGIALYLITLTINLVGYRIAKRTAQ